MRLIAEIPRAIWIPADFFRSLSPSIGNATHSLDEISKAMKSPPYAAAWELKHFNYRADTEDYWYTPQESADIVKEKGELPGDCDDIGGLTAYSLKKNGWNTRLLCIYGKGLDGVESGHATALTKDGNYITNCNFHRIHHFTKDIKTVASKWYDPLYGCALYNVKKDEYEHLEHIDGEPRETEMGMLKGKEMSEELKRFANRIKRHDSDFGNLVKESRKRFA